MCMDPSGQQPCRYRSLKHHSFKNVSFKLFENKIKTNMLFSRTRPNRYSNMGVSCEKGSHTQKSTNSCVSVTFVPGIQGGGEGVPGEVLPEDFGLFLGHKNGNPLLPFWKLQKSHLSLNVSFQHFRQRP